MIFNHLLEQFPLGKKEPPAPQQPPEEDNSFIGEDEALQDPDESTKDPLSMQTQENTDYEVPMSQVLPGDKSILCIEQQENGLYYYFKTEEGKETSKVGPFLLNFEQEIQRILKQVADNVKKFKVSGMTLIATGDFQGEEKEGQPLNMKEWEVGNYSKAGVKKLCDLLNSWVELRKTMVADFSKEGGEATPEVNTEDQDFDSAMAMADELLGDSEVEEEPKKKGIS